MRFVYTAPRYHTNQHFAMKALIEAGHEVSFLALTRGHSEEYSALSPTIMGYSSTYDRIRRLRGKRWRRDLTDVSPGCRRPQDSLPSILKFLSKIRRLRPSVMVVRNPSSSYGRLSILASIMTRAKLILYTQDPIGSLIRTHPKTLRFLDRSKLSSGVAWMTPVSESHILADENATSHTPQKAHYVPFVMEPQTSPHDRRWFRDDSINILHIGKYEPRKNHRLFLKIVARLSQRYDIRATIVGESSTPDQQSELEGIKQYCESLALQDKVDFKVNLTFGQVQDEYRKHDLFVLASSDEPAAVSPLEAMSHSLPVVCSDSNGTMCYIRPGENGFVFRSDDADDLEACLDAILSDRDKLIQMGHRSYELVISEHSPKRYVEAIERMASGKM